MKLSPIQIIASAAAAVVSAVLLSFLGDKGTILGVALGSVIATLGSAAIGESLRRGHSKVKAVASNQQWRIPGVGTLAGGAEGTAAGAESAEGGPTGAVQSSADTTATGTGPSSGNAAATPIAARTQPTIPATPGETVRPLARYSSGDRARLPVTGAATSGRPAAPRSQIAVGRAAAGPTHRPRRGDGSVFGVRWGVLLAATVLVAALAVGVVLLIQAVSGQSLGHSLGGGGAPAPTTVPTTTIPASTTTTTPRSTTTTTTTPRSSTTTTTPTTTPPTTTTVPGATVTTVPTRSGTPAAGSATTTTVPSG